MWTFEAIQSWTVETFTRFGIEFRRYKHADGHSVETAATATVAC